MYFDHRQCRTCRIEKPIDCFHTYKDSRYKNTYLSWKCRDCMTAYRRLKHRTDEQHKRNMRNSEYKIKFGITLDEYEELAAYQHHVCAICNKACTTNRNLAVDHDHKTGVVRGLLCRRCNAALGMMFDSPELLRHAADYLEGKLTS